VSLLLFSGDGDIEIQREGKSEGNRGKDDGREEEGGE
jgi:hypothetical protein